MALENLSTGTKMVIVFMALIGIIALKIYGIFSTRTTVLSAIALAVVASITDPTPTSAAE